LDPGRRGPAAPGHAHVHVRDAVIAAGIHPEPQPEPDADDAGPAAGSPQLRPVLQREQPQVIKTTPGPARLSALIGFVLACVLTLTYLWISFGGSIPLAPRGYRVEVAFPQANELATGADVRIAGVDV